jgi:hypothetical protein
MPPVADLDEVASSIADGFSLTRGGPLHRLQVRFGAAEDSYTRAIRRATVVTLLAWLPLFLFSLAQGVAYGDSVKIPFLRDFAVNVRFLIALPILILSEPGIDRRWRTLVLEFVRSGLVRETKLSSFQRLLDKVTRLRDRVLPEALMLVAAFLPSLLMRDSELLIGGASNWHAASQGLGTISLAGWWFKLISQPLFRFLLLRWTWRMFLWASFLWGVSRIDLFLVATHTDKAAGLGFLSEGQRRFSPIVFAGGAVMAAQVGNAIAYEGATLSTMKFVLVAYGVIAVLVLIAPLLVVTPLLIKTKKEALLEYGRLVTRHDQLFHEKWVECRRAQSEVLLGNRAASSLADLGTSFGVVRDMSVVPIDRATLTSLATAAALPMLPVVLFATSASDLLRIMLRMLA